MANSGVAAVIVHYRDPVSAAETMRVLRSQTVAPDVVFVVDNSAGDLPFAPDPSVRYLAMEANLGYAGAVNRVREHVAGYAHLLVVTQDVRMEPNTLSEMLSIAKVSGASCVGPRLHFRSDPTRVFSLGGAYKLGCRPVHVRSLDAISPAGFNVADWVDGAIMLLSIPALDSADWFDESYFLYFEEVDLCYRLGPGSTVVAQSAIGYQEPGNFTAYLQLRNQILFWRRSDRRGNIVIVTLRQAVRSLAAVLLKGRGSFRSVVLGIVDGIADRTGVPRGR